MLIDTHAHIHFDEYRDDADAVIERAQAAGVERIVCVGTNGDDSARAVAFVQSHKDLSATIGLHPHDAKLGQPELAKLVPLAKESKVVAVGECGLDYFRNLSPKEDQEAALRFQIELALQHDLALVFHVRDAFPDFFRIVAGYEITHAVVHCFTAGPDELARIVQHGFYVALNGIMTFTKEPHQIAVAKQVPLDRLVLETDCPYLSPVPKRGQRNEPANVKLTAEFLANLRGESLEELAFATTTNAKALFRI